MFQRTRSQNDLKPAEPGYGRAFLAQRNQRLYIDELIHSTVAIHEPRKRIGTVSGSTTSTFRAWPGLIDLLERLYVFRNYREIRQFIEHNSFLTPLLYEAYIKIGLYFPSSRRSLVVSKDPEGLGGDQLVLFIATELEPADALEQLTALDHNWWLSAIDQAKGKLCINLEFQ